MDKQKKQSIRPMWVVWLIVIIPLLACSLNLPDGNQVENGLSTAQAAGEQAAALATNAVPTLQAAIEEAQNLATNAAPTLEALQTQVVDFATGAAPTLDAGLDQLATAAAIAQGAGANVQATLEAAGIDGSYLQRKFSSTLPDENGNVNVTITETEINLFLQVRQLFPMEQGAAVAAENSEMRFTDGQAIFSAEISTPLQGALSIVMEPYIENGEIRFDILSANLNGNNVPTLLLGSVESGLSTYINTALFAIPGGVELKEVKVNEGSLTIVAGR